MSPVFWIAVVVAVVSAVRSLFSPCGLSMVSAITPFGEAARGHRYWMTAAWFTAGGVLGGLILGAACSAGAWLLSDTPLVGASASALWLAAGVAALTFCSDVKLFGLALPIHPRQVNETWLVKYRRWIYAAGFGVQIGSGFSTYIMTAAVYLTAALAVLTGDPAAALLIGILFGLVRGLLVLVAAYAKSPVRLRALHSRLAVLNPVSMTAALVCQLWAVVAAVFWAVGAPVVVLVSGAAALAVVVVELLRSPAQVKENSPAAP